MCAQVTSGTLGLSTATVKLITADNEEKIACSVGTGPVDAAYKAVDGIVKVRLENVFAFSSFYKRKVVFICHQC